MRAPSGALTVSFRARLFALAFVPGAAFASTGCAPPKAPVAPIGATLSAPPVRAVPIAEGMGHRTVDLGGTPLEIFTYRPPQCIPSSVLLVFHGLHRNADSYLGLARTLADSLCMIAVAPLFDEARFPSWRYQKGGVMHLGMSQPPSTYTGVLVLKLVAWLRTQEGQPKLPYRMIGHSAGAQFLSRFSAFVPNDAERVVIANPSSYVVPTMDVEAPFGLAGVVQPANGDAALQNDLAQPVTILLGQEDSGDKDRDDSPEAARQGQTRYERGLHTFHAAEATAAAHGWVFNWRLLEIPGVGHNAKAIFASPQAVEALTP